jgi:hypothetical protein
VENPAEAGQVFFHGVENRRKIFPWRGKSGKTVGTEPNPPKRPVFTSGGASSVLPGSGREEGGNMLKFTGCPLDGMPKTG